MTVGEFKDRLKQYNIPDDAELFVWAAFGDDGEKIGSINISRDSNTDRYSEMIFEFEKYDGIYDKEKLGEYNPSGKITAVCLYGDVM